MRQLLDTNQTNETESNHCAWVVVFSLEKSHSIQASHGTCRMPRELLEADLVHSIVGGFFDVYNYYGYGLTERIYAGALAQELRDRGHTVSTEMLINVGYKGRQVAKQRLDIVIDERVIVETKATEKVSSADRMQLISYLKATTFEVGVLLHFGPVPRFERYIDRPKRKATL